MNTFRSHDGFEIAYYVDYFTDPWTRPETMLLLHAAMGNSQRWFRWVPRLARRFRVVRMDLRGLGATRFRAVIGGDYPLGDEAPRRKTYAIRTEGTHARFLTLIEPFEDRRTVGRVEALDANRLRVELFDGRMHEITIDNFEGSGEDIRISLIETRNGLLVRSEATKVETTS